MEMILASLGLVGIFIGWSIYMASNNIVEVLREIRNAIKYKGEMK